MILKRKDIIEKLRTTATLDEIYEATSSQGINNLTDKPIPEEDIEKLKEMGMEDKTAVIENMNGERQYFHNINLGENGCGDFVDNDLKDLLEKLEYMKSCGAKDVDMTEGRRDIIDDVSGWGITFTL